MGTKLVTFHSNDIRVRRLCLNLARTNVGDPLAYGYRLRLAFKPPTKILATKSDTEQLFTPTP